MNKSKTYFARYHHPNDQITNGNLYEGCFVGQVAFIYEESLR